MSDATLAKHLQYQEDRSYQTYFQEICRDKDLYYEDKKDEKAPHYKNREEKTLKVYVENKDIMNFKKVIQNTLTKQYVGKELNGTSVNKIVLEKIISNRIEYHGYECRTLFNVKVSIS
jgi:hypothetical protein